jgi:hypothetical protein
MPEVIGLGSVTAMPAFSQAKTRNRLEVLRLERCLSLLGHRRELPVGSDVGHLMCDDQMMFCCRRQPFVADNTRPSATCRHLAGIRIGK